MKPKSRPSRGLKPSRPPVPFRIFPSRLERPLRFCLRQILLGFLLAGLICPWDTAALAAEYDLVQEENVFREEKPAEKRPVSEIEESMERSSFIRYSQDRWNEMRRRLETGEALIPKEEKPLPVAQRRALPQPPPPGPGLNVVLPYESGLSISGRKVIDFKLSSTIYEQPDIGKGRINKADFELDQQLQVRVKGTVGRKVTVNVDFDDTREDKRDISVVYKGDPDEVLQEAAFGDITISLPSTEFVNYSKSVFGARAELQFRPRSGFAKLFPSMLWHRRLPNKLKFYLIGSRTKGITQTKRFTGKSELRRAGPNGEGINDISYARRQFYLLAFATGPAPAADHRAIVAGSEKIFLDDQDPTNNNINESTRTFRVYESSMTDTGGVSVSTEVFQGISNSSNTGVFKQLIPGIDYTVDYFKGVIRFIRPVQQRDIIVADYIPKGETLPISQTLPDQRGNTDFNDTKVPDEKKSNDALKGFKPFLIKPDESQFFATREMKNYYDLGAKRLVRDDGRGSFILKVIDTNRQDPAEINGLNISTQPQNKPLPRYPNDMDVDFDNGIISFVSSDTFRSPNRPFTDDIYVFRDAVPASNNGINLNRYRIFAEFRIRKGDFNLEQISLVSQSEKVFVDGKKMTRDVDYFIDYDVGIVSFFRPEIIREDSVIEITYDYSPFGGQGEETLVGMRQEWYLTDNFFLGNSVLLNFAPRSRGVPDLRSTSRSITVLEGDVNWNNVKIGNFPIQMNSFSAEIARSIKNPNTANKATLETFEGVKLEDSANLNKDSWQVAANPDKGNHLNSNNGFANGFAALSAGERGVALSNEDVKITDINPSAPVESTDRLQILRADYNLQTTTEAASFVQVLNRAGVDFYTNRRQFMELWIFGDNSGNRVQFRLGGVAELSDHSTPSQPKTEDDDVNGVLSPGEDTGWQFLNPDGSTTTVGNGNGRLDTQDLDGNRKIDPDDGNGNYLNEIGSVDNPLREPDGTVHTTVDWSGWKVFQVPLNIPTTGQAQWSSIKQVRGTVIRQSATTPATGFLRFGRISVVGTRFGEPIVEPSSASARAFAENSNDNPGYPSLVNNPTYQDLYDIQDTTTKRREQALAIQYQRTAQTFQISTVTVKEVFTRPLDISEHKKLRFFVYGDNSGNTFFLRIGSPGNFLEYRLPLTFSDWKLIQLDITDSNRDGKLDSEDFSPPGKDDADPTKWHMKLGGYSLKNIAEITMGVLITPGADTGIKKVYVNEIHLTESLTLVGDAARTNAEFSWPGWGSWGGGWRKVGRNFQTLTSAASGVDTESYNAHLNVDRLKFLPLSGAMSRTETTTPQVQTLNDPNTLYSFLDEGKTVATNESLSGNMLMTQLPLLPYGFVSKLPNVNFSADHTLSFRNDGVREDETFNYRYGTSYSTPWQPDILPTQFLVLRPLPTSMSYSFSENQSNTKVAADNTDTTSIGRTYTAAAAFQPFPRMSLSPNYSLSNSTEERSELDPNKPIILALRDTKGKINKNQKQNASLSGSLRVTNWLSPSFSYTITSDETYNVNNVVFGSSTFRRGEIKSINRSSNGDVSASLSPKDMFQYVRYLRAVNPMINSLNFSGGYTVTDADTYENVDGGFEIRDKLFIRDNNLDLNGQNANARRTSLTATDTSRLAGRWTPFEGFTFLKSRLWAPLKNISGSGTFTETKTKRDTTGTTSFSYSKVWPDFVVSTYEIERPLFLSRWMSDTRLNGNYQERLSEVLEQTRSTGKNVGTDFTFTLFRLLQFSVGYTNNVTQEEDLKTNLVTARTRTRGINGQVITTLKWGNWRFTPRYDQSQSEAEDGTGKKTSDLVNRNGSLQVFGDINVPRFFRLPFGKQLSLANRLILTSSFRYGTVRDGVDETKSKDSFDFNMNGDFEVTPNIRVAFGGSYARTLFKTKKEEDFSVLTFTSRVTIQF